MKPAAGQRAGYRVARDRGGEYLLQQRRPDGGFGPWLGGFLRELRWDRDSGTAEN